MQIQNIFGNFANTVLKSYASTNLMNLSP